MLLAAGVEGPLQAEEPFRYRGFSTAFDRSRARTPLTMTLRGDMHRRASLARLLRRSG